ncbi:MAG: hypothetical protein E2576_10965 [Alcaligenaceae bacterium]|nr:hypothetical protein [Alcaligenaceae bacterium SAGV5]MPS51272.1 hypothetical protein [Alcaligenaceae bacterium SAGV3]MPT57231.1 hypothetical protein [Alcaligenaceae bacterium]
MMIAMPAWQRYGAVAATSLVIGAAVAWTVQKWRLGAEISDQRAASATERQEHSDLARIAEADQRTIEFNRMEANAHVTYQTQRRIEAAAVALRDRDAAIVGLRNALAAAEFRSGQAGSDSDPRSGADDPATLRTVVRECTAEYSTMVGNAISAGVAVTGLQAYALRVSGSSSNERNSRVAR